MFVLYLSLLMLISSSYLPSFQEIYISFYLEKSLVCYCIQWFDIWDNLYLSIFFLLHYSTQITGKKCWHMRFLKKKHSCNELIPIFRNVSEEDSRFIRHTTKLTTHQTQHTTFGACCSNTQYNKNNNSYHINFSIISVLLKVKMGVKMITMVMKNLWMIMKTIYTKEVKMQNLIIENIQNRNIETTWKTRSGTILNSKPPLNQTFLKHKAHKINRQYQ